MSIRRIQLVREKLDLHLGADTLGIVIDYVQIPEAELVMIALQNKAEHRSYSDYIIYKSYMSGPIVPENPDDPDNELKRSMSECDMWISNDGYADTTEYLEPPLFTLGFGYVYTLYRIKITLSDLLPSATMNTIIVPNGIKTIFDICWPMYLKEIQSEIDAI